MRAIIIILSNRCISLPLLTVYFTPSVTLKHPHTKGLKLFLVYRKEPENEILVGIMICKTGFEF